jgi:trimeric autotransporter adhesin
MIGSEEKEPMTCSAWRNKAVVVCAGLAIAAGVAGCGIAGSVSYGTITTVAGTSAIGYSGDGGPAIAAKLWGPTCVALDSAGNLYLGDSANDAIRKVSAATGIISTYAGGNGHGYSGDNGPATAATMYAPTDCVMDRAGNLYLADDANNVIRKVAAGTGIITTVAGNGYEAGSPDGGYAGDGGPAVLAEINHPFGVALDGAGNLYIADTYNYRVRRVDAASGVITTVAGNGTHGFAGDGGPATSAELYGPEGMALDAAGNLYIADVVNGVIRMVSAATGKISTVAGTPGASGFSGDGGSATGAVLNYPTGVALTAAGDMYISDTSNMRIRRVPASSGIIQTVVGDGQGYSGDGGPSAHAEINNPWKITFDAGGAMYIADFANSVVRKVTPAQ